MVVKALDALWDDDVQEYGVKLSQSGRTFKGRTVFRVQNLTGATIGSIDSGLQVSYSTAYFPGVSDSFEGRLDAGLDRMTGKLTLHVFGSTASFNMNFVRK